MKATIGIYNDQSKALEAIQTLKAAGFPDKQISLIAKNKVAEQELEPGESGMGPGRDSDEVYEKPQKIAATDMSIAVILGPILGALTGLGLVAVPGFGIVLGAGALAGAVAGLDIGLITGGIITALRVANVNKHHEDLYQEHLQRGNFLVVAQGDETQIDHAREVLSAHNTHTHLETHN